MESEIVAVDIVENIAEASASQTIQGSSNIEEKNDSDQVNDDIRSLADEQNVKNELSKKDETDLDKITEVMDNSTAAPQNSGDGGNLSAEMPKYSEDQSSPGYSNVRIKKRRRNLNIVTFNKREILPRKTKTKAYECLKNMAPIFYAASAARDRRRAKRKRLIREINERGNTSRKRRGGKKPPLRHRRSRVTVRDSGTSISSVMTLKTASSNMSSFYNDSFA